MNKNSSVFVFYLIYINCISKVLPSPPSNGGGGGGGGVST